ncbi:MAG TPA: retropepsin-like aspartic protease [Pyrinomonadaceae bacterium]|nr:retropepsin-like aspartic protease [Pyrinomonadaceae bacterium]
MDRKLVACSVVLLVACLHLSVSAASDAQLKSLYANKQYFDLRDALLTRGSDRSAELLFYRAVVSNKFNQPQASINFIQNYLERSKGINAAEFVRDSYELLADNHVKTYEYRKAAEAYRTLLAKFGRGLDAKKVEDLENSARLCGALSGVPRQSVTHGENSRIGTTTNALKLTELPVEVNGRKHAFIFDTGANFSTASYSFARKLGFKIIEARIKVGAINGNNVTARLGVAPTLGIGNTIINNVVFLVFEDKDLYVAPVKYQITAIIGFPVIEGLKEISFHRNGEVFISAKRRSGGEQNMALDGLTPVLAGEFRGKRLTFTFDTGANRTNLYPPFFRAYEQEIRNRYAPHTERLAGTGGVQEISAYRIRDLEMKFSGKVVRFTEVTVLTEPTLGKSRYFYGNLGQDLVQQFEEMTLNFEAMSVVFQ